MTKERGNILRGEPRFVDALTPSEHCKRAGLVSLAELVRLSGVPKQTLIDWHRHRPSRFNCMLAGAVALRKDVEQ